MLGLDTKKTVLRCTCPETECYHGGDESHPMAQRLNNKNNSYLTHFLMFAFPPKKFKSTPSLLSSLLEVVSLDLGKVCREGFWIGDTQYHVAIVGMAGDMEHHSKTGILNRSYQNVVHKNFLACCHECHAGLIAYPFEDVSSDPKWKETLYSSVPWAVTPPFKHIPFANWDTGEAARFFKRDPFHIFRLGIARHFIGSTVVMYCLQGVFDSPGDSSISIEARLRRAWGCFSLWCDAHHVSTAGIRSFTKEKLHMQATGAFPWVGCKGSDTILLLKWLRFKSGLYAAQNCSFKDVFQLVHKTALTVAWLSKPSTPMEFGYVRVAGCKSCNVPRDSCKITHAWRTVRSNDVSNCIVWFQNSMPWITFLSNWLSSNLKSTLAILLFTIHRCRKTSSATSVGNQDGFRMCTLLRIPSLHTKSERGSS